jgi:hypothetical protein
MRCGVAEASGHVTMKPSIRNRAMFYKSGVYAGKAWCLTPGGLHGVEGSTEFRAIGIDRRAEVSRGHSRLSRTTEGPNKLRTVIAREELTDGICRAAIAVPASGRG